MERAHGQGIAAVAYQPVQPFPHLLGGLVGESHGKDIERADLVLADQVSDTVGDDPGFAAAGPGNNQQRAVDSLDSVLLRGVKSFQ